MLTIYYFILLIVPFLGLVGLFVLKDFEIRGGAVFLCSLRKKGDRGVLKVLAKCKDLVRIGRSWKFPVPSLSRTASVVRGVYSITNRVIQNKPMRLTGIAHSKAYYATERVSKYLREVSKSKERGTVSSPQTIEDQLPT